MLMLTLLELLLLVVLEDEVLDEVEDDVGDEVLDEVEDDVGDEVLDEDEEELLDVVDDEAGGLLIMYTV